MLRSDGSHRALRVARLRLLGHLTYGGLVRASLACFALLAAAFAGLPLAPETLARVGLLVVGLGWLALLAIYLSVDGTVVVRAHGGWYVAEDARAGIARHGRSVDEALANLARMLEPAGRDA